MFLCWSSPYWYQKQLSCFILCEWRTAGGKQGNTSSKTRAMKAVFAVRSPQIIFTASVFGSGRGNERVSRASLAIRIHNCYSSSFQANFVFVTFGRRDPKFRRDIWQTAIKHTNTGTLNLKFNLEMESGLQKVIFPIRMCKKVPSCNWPAASSKMVW